ncbi:uncharacterized protein LOC111701629, partial [Eurytemora carolleeae]|uniref:uncharacterized protein LOC111701629 n=1 Tax=Eurytemora carolleeae TaxID=1294199 RepID=UPI000C794BD5
MSITEYIIPEGGEAALRLRRDGSKDFILTETKYDGSVNTSTIDSGVESWCTQSTQIEDKRNIFLENEETEKIKDPDEGLELEVDSKQYEPQDGELDGLDDWETSSNKNQVLELGVLDKFQHSGSIQGKDSSWILENVPVYRENVLLGKNIFEETQSATKILKKVPLKTGRGIKVKVSGVREIPEKIPGEREIPEKVSTKTRISEKAPDSREMLEKGPSGRGNPGKVSTGNILVEKLPPVLKEMERVSPGRGILETVPFTTEIREKVSSNKDLLEKVSKELNEKVLSIIDVDEMVPTGREIHEKGPNNKIRLEKIPPIFKVGEMVSLGKAQDKVSPDCGIKSSFNPEIFESKEPLMKVPLNLKGDKKKSLQQGNSGWGILNRVSRQRKAKESWNDLRTQLIKQQVDKDGTVYVQGEKYTVLSSLGEGGYAKVYSAFGQDKKVIALKVCNLVEENGRININLENESRILNKLNNTNHVIRLLRFEHSGDLLKMVLELGQVSLLTWRQNTENLLPAHLKIFWDEAVTGISEIHSFNIIHMDVKPDNFILVNGVVK